MAWSIFRDGGGGPAAVQWAHDLLATLGVAQTPADVQMVYDWEVSEGGGGKFNPLNQGPVPGHPELTTTGSQYGGGAADFASYQAGVTGAADYLHMPAYAGVLAALTAGDGPAARSALIASPWAASHYNGGANFSTAPIPGGTSALTGTAAGGSSSATGTIHLNTPLGSIDTGIPDAAAMGHYAMLAAGVIAGLVLVVLGASRATDAHPVSAATATAKKAGEAVAVA